MFSVFSIYFYIYIYIIHYKDSLYGIWWPWHIHLFLPMAHMCISHHLGATSVPKKNVQQLYHFQVARFRQFLMLDHPNDKKIVFGQVETTQCQDMSCPQDTFSLKKKRMKFFRKLETHWNDELIVHNKCLIGAWPTTCVLTWKHPLVETTLSFGYCSSCEFIVALDLDTQNLWPSDVAPISSFFTGKPEISQSVHSPRFRAHDCWSPFLCHGFLAENQCYLHRKHTCLVVKNRHFDVGHLWILVVLLKVPMFSS